jgi:chromosome segregation protein
VQLSSLTLNGFKSFGDRTNIEFAPGVTAIVGPNGSGKSNIIDALRWALGGGRASEYRAEEKLDLIFHGAAGKKSLGFAEVELEFRKDKQKIHVGRNLYRDGSTRLKLNGQNARLLDIEEALSGTGLGRGGVSIIGQGEVGQVLMADPPKLLAYVAEAAGVAKLAARREQAQDRLDTAKEHLERLAEVMVGLSTQVERLSIEASQAERHNELTRDQLTLRYTLSVQRETSLALESKELQGQEAQLTEDLDLGKARLAETQQRWHALRQTLQTLEDTYRQALTEAEAKRGDVRVAEERLASVSDQQNALSREIASLRTEMLRLESLDAPHQPGESIFDLEKIEAERKQSLEELQAVVARIETHLREGQSHLDTLRKQIAQDEQSQAAYTSKREQLLSQLSLIEARLGSFEALFETLGDINPLEEEVLNLRQQLSELEQTVEGQRQRFVSAQQIQAQANAQAQAIRKTAQRARAEFEARRGYAQGPRHALSSGISGIYGSVADLIRVPNEYRQAVSSALGRRAEYIVVDTADTAQKVIAHVRAAGGWVTVLPIELVEARPSQLNSEIAAQEGIIDLAVNLVSFESTYAQIIYQLFGNTTLIQSMENAVRIAKGFKQRPRLVTLDGDTLEGYGAMTGGQNRSSVSVVGAAFEVEEAEQHDKEAEEKATQAEQNLHHVQTSLQARLSEQQTLSAGFSERSNLLNKRREETAITLSLQNELREQKESFELQVASLVDPTLQADYTTLEHLEPNILELQVQVHQNRVNLSEATQLYQEARQQLMLAVERSRQYEIEIKRFETEQQRLEDIKGQWLEAEKRSAVIAEQRKEVEGSLELAKAALPKDLEEKRGGVEQARRETQLSEESLNEHTEGQAQKAEALEQVKLTLARREAALEIAREEKKNFPEGLEGLPLSNRQARDKLGYVEQELTTLGPVNHRASLELSDQRTKLEDLEIQGVQATLAVTELESTLQKIDAETNLKMRPWASYGAIDKITTSRQANPIAHAPFGWRAHHGGYGVLVFIDAR